MSLNKTLTLLLSSAAGATGALSLGGLLLSPPSPGAQASERTAAASPPAPDAGQDSASRPRGPQVAPASPYVGVILPEHATDVAAPQSGIVERVEVTLGERVEEGQLLVRLSVEQADLDHQRARAERAAASAALARSRIEHKHAIEHARRSELLAAEGLATQDELAQARFKLEESHVLAAEAEARLRERSARAVQLAAIRDDTRVLASFRGRVAGRYVDAGALVAAGTPLLRLISDGHVLLRFALPEHDDRLAVGQHVEVIPSEHRGRTFVARVVRLSPEIDAASRMRTVEATLLEPARVVEQGLVGALVRVTPRNERVSAAIASDRAHAQSASPARSNPHD